MNTINKNIDIKFFDKNLNKFITYISSHQWAATSKWSVFEIGCLLVDWYALRAFPEGVEVSGNFHNLAFIPSFFKNSYNWLDCKVLLSSQPSRTISAPRGDDVEVVVELGVEGLEQRAEAVGIPYGSFDTRLKQGVNEKVSRH